MQQGGGKRVYYLIISRSITAESVRQAHHAAHLAWLDDERSSGRLLLSGPSVDRSLGIYLIAAEDTQAAATIAKSDPYHAEGVRSFEVVDWQVQRVADGVRLPGSS